MPEEQTQIPTDKNEIATFNFEKSIEQVETILTDLENTDLSFDESIKKYEYGSKLIKECVDKLSKTKNRIQKIVVDNNEVNIEEF